MVHLASGHSSGLMSSSAHGDAGRGQDSDLESMCCLIWASLPRLGATQGQAGGWYTKTEVLGRWRAEMGACDRGKRTFCWTRLWFRSQTSMSHTKGLIWEGIRAHLAGLGDWQFTWRMAKERPQLCSPKCSMHKREQPAPLVATMSSQEGSSAGRLSYSTICKRRLQMDREGAKFLPVYGAGMKSRTVQEAPRHKEWIQL